MSDQSDKALIEAMKAEASQYPTDPYYIGMYNGAEFALACLDKRQPIYKNPPRIKEAR